MIRDFDEFGAQPLRGPGAFRRPAVDESALVIFEYNHGEAMRLVEHASRLFWSGKRRFGLELVWDNVRRAERYPALVRAMVLMRSLRILAHFGPVRRSLQVARHGLELAPSRGRNAFISAGIHGEMTHLYHRLGDHDKVLRHGLLTLAEGRRQQLRSLRCIGEFRYSQHLLRIGRPELGLDGAREAAKLYHEWDDERRPLKPLIYLNLAQVTEALGLRKEAHEAYQVVTLEIGNQGFSTRAEHETAWDGYHRTKQ